MSIDTDNIWKQRLLYFLHLTRCRTSYLPVSYKSGTDLYISPRSRSWHPHISPVLYKCPPLNRNLPLHRKLKNKEDTF